ncbi:MAG: signal peptidase I [Tissierellia bacterium]|nr:signal peptidase I [Tissierellia bacterium]
METKQNTNEVEEKETLGGFLATLMLYIGIALIIRFFVFNITSVEGTSMIPSLQDGDRLITNKIVLFLREPRHGEIVVVKAPNGSGSDYIKRIIGLPGDHIKIVDGQVYRNDEMLMEHYTSSDNTQTEYQNEWVVEEDSVFVLGDNRLPGGSNDSRLFGTIPMDDVRGVSMFRIWPLDHFGTL